MPSASIDPRKKNPWSKLRKKHRQTCEWTLFVQEFVYEFALFGVTKSKRKSRMRDVYNRKFDAIAIQSVVDSGDFVRFNQGRLHEFIVQKRSRLAQERSFMLWACFVHNVRLGTVPVYPLSSSVFPHPRICPKAGLARLFLGTRGLSTFFASAR
jgi:hypothetical protein